MKPWISRCLPILSSAGLAALIIVAFQTPPECHPRVPSTGAATAPTAAAFRAHHCRPRLSLAQLAFLAYNFALHMQSIVFCCQLAVALWWMTRNVRAVRRRAALVADLEAKRHYGHHKTPSQSSLSASVASGSLSSYASDSEEEAKSIYMMQDFIDSLGELQAPEDRVVHAIILPNYMEDLGTLRETLDVLASHRRARSQYEVYLAMEEKEAGSTAKAKLLVTEFAQCFLAIKSSIHPYGIPGEAAGKSSNVAFAARKIFANHERDGQDTIITVMDADTHFLDDYFSELRRMHVAHPATAQRTVYQCPVIFDRNANASPVLVRTADMVWIWGSLAGLMPGTPLSVPISVYSLPLRLAESVGGWDSDPGSIGEDMHMLLKCFFRTGGGVGTRAVFSAVSQCNVSGDAPTSSAAGPDWKRNPWARAFLPDVPTMVARYKQGLRHMWGSLDSGYAARETLKAGTGVLGARHLALMYVLWQAHFLILHFFIALVLPAVITTLRAPGTVHPTLLAALSWSAGMRAAAFVMFNAVFFLHDTLHDVCARARETDMAAAGLPCAVERRKWYRPKHLAERACLPVVGVVYGVLPAVVAQLSHLWTDELVYVVAGKPKVEGMGIVNRPKLSIDCNV